MAEASLANKNEPPSGTPDAEYDRIFKTLAETETGRRFLDEYARRCQPADSDASLATIQRLQAVIRAGGASERLRLLNEIVEMAEAITRARAEMMAVNPGGGTSETSEALDWTIRATESATSRILAATEQVQEAAWSLRAKGAELAVCDRLDALATEIYTACTFQDLTGQRTRKAIAMLRDLETRINELIGAGDSAAAGIAALGNAELAQADVDAMLAGDAPQEERQEASLEDISRFMQALEPLMVPQRGNNGDLRAHEPAAGAVEETRPELSVADAVMAETAEVRAITEWGVEPAATTPQQPVVQEASADWVVSDASPMPEAEPDWMILRRLEMELDAQEQADEPQAREQPLPPANVTPAAVEIASPSSPPAASAKEECDEFLFDSAGPGSAAQQDQTQPAAGPPPGPSDTCAEKLPEPAQAKPSSAEGEPPKPRATYDPLAPIRAMSDEQKIALFS